MQQPSEEGNTAIGPTYSVGDATCLVGVSPDTVRLYEREGLLQLRRTPGGHRYLTEADLGILKRIQTLRRTQGAGLETIRQELQRGTSPLPPTSGTAKCQ